MRANYASNTVSRIDVATNRVVATIKVSKYPHGIAADQRGLWVTHLGQRPTQVNHREIQGTPGSTVTRLPIAPPSRAVGPVSASASSGNAFDL